MEGLNSAPSWNFKVRPSRLGEFCVAWCARVSDDEMGDGPMEVSFSEEVHFEFGRTPEEALDKLKRKVLS